MILYTIMPPEKVFDRWPSPVKDYSPIEIYYKGERVQVIPVDGNKYTIVRLLSTSPKSFLNPTFQPGTIIKIPFEAYKTTSP